MSPESQIPIPSPDAKRFASRLAVFYATSFTVAGTYLPFFTVWLKAVGIEASLIGLIVAAPAVTRFTLLPFITAAAERRNAIRAAMIITAVITALGFSLLGILRAPLLIFVVFVLTACFWTPIVPLTDGYALKAVARYGLNYGPLRLWGSAAFIAGALVSGVLADLVAAEQLIWLIVAFAWVGALAGFGLRPLDAPAKSATPQRGASPLRNPTFLTIVVAAALIQGSHAAYYTFASIAWQGAGLSGTTISVLWVLGVVAEIVVFALSPRFTWSPMWLMLGGALSAVLRWSITAQDPSLPVLTVVQLLHGFTFGLTQVGTMGLLVRHVPGHVIARGQGYYTAAAGFVMSAASIASGAVFARYGLAVYDMMAAMGLAGAIVLVVMRRRLLAPASADQPHSAGSGG